MISGLGDYLTRIRQGMTFNAGDEISAGIKPRRKMYKRGTWNPATGYEYAKAAEDIYDEQSRKNTGLPGTAAEVGGAIGSGVGLARSGLTATGLLSQAPGAVGRAATGFSATSVARVLRDMAHAWALRRPRAGHLADCLALEGEGTDRLANAGVGTIAGSVLGPVLSTGASGLGYVAAKPLSQKANSCRY